MRKVVIFGGSFNPPHEDHRRILEWLVRKCPLDIDEIWVLPAVNHAFNKNLAPYKDRETMVGMMVDEVIPNPHKRIKILKQEERYMVETLEDLHSKYPDTEFHLVVGGDILHETDKWHRWEDVVCLANLLPVVRQGAPIHDGYDYIEVESQGFSSTCIREKIAKEDLDHLVQEMVSKNIFLYIQDRGLYSD